MAYERLFKLRVGTLEINKSELFHLRNRCAATGLRVRGFLRNLIALDHAECVGLELKPISPLSEDAEISTNTDRRTKATPEVVQIVLHLLDQITPVRVIAERTGLSATSIRRIRDGHKKLVQTPCPRHRGGHSGENSLLFGKVGPS